MQPGLTLKIDWTKVFFTQLNISSITIPTFLDKLNEQFLNYQLLMPGDIPAFVKEKAGLD